MQLYTIWTTRSRLHAIPNCSLQVLSAYLSTHWSKVSLLVHTQLAEPICALGSHPLALSPNKRLLAKLTSPPYAPSTNVHEMNPMWVERLLRVRRGIRVRL